MGLSEVLWMVIVNIDICVNWEYWGCMLIV